MKTKRILTAAFALLASCTTLQTLGEKDLPYAQFEAYTACKLYLSFGVAPKDQADMKANIYAIASFVNSFSGGTVPTPDQVKEQLLKLSDNTAEFVDLVNSFYEYWSGWFPSIKGNPALAFQLTQRFSAGAMLATKPGTAMLRPSGSVSYGLINRTR